MKDMDTKKVFCGNVQIGGGAPVSIQSMTNVDTRDTDALLDQINRLTEAGCQIVRVAIPDEEAADSFAEVRKKTDVPLVCDIHFDYRLALRGIEAGADKIRINPGNIGDRENVLAVVNAAKKAHIPIRIGVNSGSLEKDILASMGVTADALCESAMRNVRMVEEMDFDDIVISLKSSNVKMTVEAYRKLSAKTDHPLHIGVTEAGTPEAGKIKSAVGIGALLLDGIGDTLRVSLTADPVEEVYAAEKILSACGLYEPPIEMVSCPTCGRTMVDLVSIAGKVERELSVIGKQRKEAGRRPLKVAVMGCVVNGPGEAREADFGVACGKGKGVIFRKGEPVMTVAESDILPQLVKMAREAE